MEIWERKQKKEYKNDVLVRVTVEKQKIHCDHKELVGRAMYVAMSSYLIIYWKFKAHISIQEIDLVVKWLGLCTSTAGGTGSIPGWRTKVLPRNSVKKKEKLTARYLS